MAFTVGNSRKGGRFSRSAPKAPYPSTIRTSSIQAVLRDVDIGVSVEEPLKNLIAEGRLIQVLRDWCPPFPGYFLYYPSRRNQPAALVALIEALRLSV